MERLRDKLQTYFRQDPADFLFPFGISGAGFFILTVLQRIRESDIVCPTTALNVMGWTFWGIGAGMLTIFYWRCFRWDQHVNKPLPRKRQLVWSVWFTMTALGLFVMFQFLREMSPQEFKVTIEGNRTATVTIQRYIGNIRAGCVELPLTQGTPPNAVIVPQLLTAVWKLQPPDTRVMISRHHVVKVIADPSSCSYNGKQVLRIPIQIYPTYPGKGGVEW